MIRREGFLTFIERVVRWLKGERTNYIIFQDIINDEGDVIDLAVLLADPSEEELTLQREQPAPVTIAIVTPLYQPPLEIWRETVESVLNQTYANWKWYVADAGTDTQCWDALLAYDDDRIHPIKLEVNQGISGNTNTGLKAVTEDWIVMLDHDDMLAPHALYTLYKSIKENPDTDVFYSDYDKIALNGERVEPFFKPEWTPDTLLCANIVTHMTTFRRKMLDRAGYLDPQFDGSQDWDLYLRFSEVTDKFVHIPAFLYHWRIMPSSVAQSMDNKPYAQIAQRNLLEAFFARNQISDFEIDYDTFHPVRKVYPQVSWRLSNTPHLSIVIDVQNVAHLPNLLKWVVRCQHDVTCQLVLVTSQQFSEQINEILNQETHLNQSLQNMRLTFAQTRQQAIAQTDGQLLLFLRSNLRFLRQDNLLHALQWCDRPKTGAIGIKILDKKSRIVHAGLHKGENGDYISYFEGYKHNIWSPYGTDCWYRNVPAVGSGFLLISRKIYDEVGWFDFSLETALQEIDLCERIIDAGYRNLYTPDIIAIIDN